MSTNMFVCLWEMSERLLRLTAAGSGRREGVGCGAFTFLLRYFELLSFLDLEYVSILQVENKSL